MDVPHSYHAEHQHAQAAQLLICIEYCPNFAPKIVPSIEF